MNGKTRHAKIRNYNIRILEYVELTHKIKKIVENRLRWFERLEKIPLNYVIRMVGINIKNSERNY